jgi:imidazolonepropionase-like amidohydrolase
LRRRAAEEILYARYPAKLVALLLASSLAARPSGAQGASDSGRVIVLVGGKIYPSPSSPAIDNGVVLIRGALISAVGSRDAVAIPANSEVIDCSGRVILAGFWNSHIHLTEPHWAGADTLPAAALTDRLRRMLVQYGFVRVLDTGSPLSNTLAIRRRIERGEVLGPDILTTGPGFVPENASPFYILPDRLPELKTAEQAQAQVAERFEEGAHAIKLFTGSVPSPTTIVPMRVDIVRAATAEAKRRGRLAVAHPGNTAGLEAAREGGVDILAHTSPDGGPWPVDLPRKLKRAGMALIPTLKLWEFELSRRGADTSRVRRFVGVAIDQLRSYNELGGEILFGTDVGYMTDYDPAAEMRYMQRAGMSFIQILAALTTAPAKRLRVSERATGKLEPGKDADVVVLDGDPAHDIGALSRVRYVLRQGRRIFARR